MSFPPYLFQFLEWVVYRQRDTAATEEHLTPYPARRLVRAAFQKLLEPLYLDVSVMQGTTISSREIPPCWKVPWYCFSYS